MLSPNSGFPGMKVWVSCHDSILVAHVARHVDASHNLILCMEFTDNLLCTVAAAVIDENHHGVFTDKPFCYHSFEEGCQLLYAVMQHSLFIITHGETVANLIIFLLFIFLLSPQTLYK